VKKVLIINTTLNKGGAARVAHDLWENLNSDLAMFFAYGRGVKVADKQTFYFGCNLEMFIHIFLVRFFGLEGFGSYFSTKKLIKFIKHEKFDLVNLHNLHGYYLNFFMLLNFLRTENIPVIYSLHDEWPITWLPAHSLGCEHCKTGHGKCINTYTYPKNYFPLFTKYMLRRKMAALTKMEKMVIVCPSLWLGNSIKASWLDKFPLKIINNGVDVNIFKPVADKNTLRAKYNLPNDKKIIFFTASNLNDNSKGINYMVAAAKTLIDKNYLFVGAGQGSIENTVNLKTFGYVYDKKQLAEMYALSDCFCFASAAETFLLSAAEALACGVPVLGFDLPVVRELVNSEVGILTPKNDGAKLAQAIDSLLSDEAKLQSMSQAGRTLIEAKYTKEFFYHQYRELYNNCLK